MVLGSSRWEHGFQTGRQPLGTWFSKLVLNLPELVYPVFGMCIGYPDQAPEIKPRLPLPVVLKKDSYSNAQDSELLADYDKVIRDYYHSRTGGTKDMSWSEQIAGMLVKEARPHMLEFLKSRGYLLK